MVVRRVLVGIALCGLPLWSGQSVLGNFRQVQWDLIVASRSVTVAEGLVFCHLLILVVWAVLVAPLVLSWARRRRTVRRGDDTVVPFVGSGVASRATAWLSASAILVPSSPSAPVTPRTEMSVPVGTVVSPAMAAGVLAHVIRRRREQAARIRFEGRPDRLEMTELTTLGALRHMAIEYDSSGPATVQVESRLDDLVLAAADVDPDVRKLLDAVERPLVTEIAPAGCAAREWQVVVRVFGYPLVANSTGAVAEFRKKRALELLTWLCLNRDRQRRSAARTALWEFDVSDGTFSTVVWEMRRTLADLCPPSDSREWCPATYSDEIPLKSTVVTDADLLEDAVRRFERGECSADEVSRYLAWVRDVPFAGTTYSWADLDGTTTRLVILAVDAATMVARWAIENERPDLVTDAVAAGLRVMPGCEELLALQEQIVRVRSVRVSARSRR